MYFIGICKGLSEESTLCQITYLCNLFELTSYFKFCIRSLSPGTLRKVNLVVALMGPPRILILDDPFRDVDPYVTRVISKCLRNYVYSKNMAVIMACRNLSKRLFPNARRYHIHSLTPWSFKKLNNSIISKKFNQMVHLLFHFYSQLLFGTNLKQWVA